MLYFLMLLVTVAIIFAWIGWIPYKPLDIIYTNVVLYVTCYVSNWIFSRALKIPANYESDSITAMILTLIITPGAGWLFLVLAAVFSQASKYILAIRGKHIFNPAAIGVIITILVINQGASWWVGNVYLLPFVVIGGLLIARKLQHFDLVFSFLIVHLLIIGFKNSSDFLSIWQSTLVNSSLLYFTFVMLVEPLTTPPTRVLRIAYGSLIGLIMSFTFVIGPLYSSPELALVLGNIFSFLVSDKARYKLTFKQKNNIAKESFDFIFDSNHKLNNRPGQYLEWTLPQKKSDLRGNRRYFTVASSPTESEVHLGSKFYEKPSTFKQDLLALNIGDKIFAGQLAGDFVLPDDQNKKLVFIAGGIGITPFRSMIKYLIDKNEKRDIVLFYSVKTEDEIAYKEVIDQANSVGVKVVYIITDKVGFLDAEKIKNNVTDLNDRTFYISGPRGMVVAFEKLLKDLGVSRTMIKTDFFPGYV